MTRAGHPPPLPSRPPPPSVQQHSETQSGSHEATKPPPPPPLPPPPHPPLPPSTSFFCNGGGFRLLPLLAVLAAAAHGLPATGADSVAPASSGHSVRRKRERGQETAAAPTEGSETRRRSRPRLAVALPPIPDDSRARPRRTPGERVTSPSPRPSPTRARPLPRGAAGERAKEGRRPGGGAPAPRGWAKREAKPRDLQSLARQPGSQAFLPSPAHRGLFVRLTFTHFSFLTQILLFTPVKVSGLTQALFERHLSTPILRH